MTIIFYLEKYIHKISYDLISSYNPYKIKEQLLSINTTNISHIYIIKLLTPISILYTSKNKDTYITIF